MPTFEYRALKSGTSISVVGTIDADTLRDARSKLRLRGETPLRLQEIRAKGEGLKGFLSKLRGGNHQKEIQVFTTQLATLIRSGITLTDGLRVLSSESHNKQFAKILNLVYQSVVEKGTTFADALQPFPDCFPPLFVSMVRAGESTGSLPIVLDRLAIYAKKRDLVETKIRSALAYPLFMLAICMLVVSFLLSYLVPKIVDILDQQKKALPIYTEILIKISDIFSEYWWLGAILVLVGIVGGRLIVATPKGRYQFDKLILFTPIIGELLRKGAVSRFCVTLASLLKSGVKIEDALRIVKDVVGNKVVAGVVEKISERIKEGASISEPLRDNKIFPKIVTFMISVGEKAGSDELQEMLDNISEAFDVEIEQSANRMTSILGPVMLLVMAGIIGYILIAVLVPIMNLSQI